MIHLKIDFPTLIDIIHETDPKLHSNVFLKASNDIVLRSIPKMNTRIKRKWNLVMSSIDRYNWVVTSSLDKSSSKSGGRINFKEAKPDFPIIVIKTDGEPINDLRFDYSFGKQIKALTGLKKQAAIIKKRDRAGKDANKPRVKILKKGMPTVLSNAFYQTMRNGHYGIFRRKEAKKIIELRTITLPSMLEQINYEEILDTHYKENMTKRYDHYLLMALKKEF